MRLSGVELRTVTLPLVTPFRTSLGTQTVRNALLVSVTLDSGHVGWGECVADETPEYCAEYRAGAEDMLVRFLVPPLFAADDLDAALVTPLLAHFRGHRMAKAAVEMAVLDAQLRRDGIALSRCLGGVRRQVPVGVSVGIADSLDDLIATVDRYLGQGYRRIKLKIEPGWDLEPIRAVRSHFGDIPLQVDANAAYTRGDIAHLRGLDAYGLILLEQPFDPEDLPCHADLATCMDTPVCLDESVRSPRDAAAAIAMRACSVVNIKPGRVGGLLAARSVHDVCFASGVPVWCGGMLETGLGRAANLALAALPGFTLPGDISETRRYFSRDVTADFRLCDGMIAVPNGHGIGVAPDGGALDAATTSIRRLSPDGLV